MKILYYNSKKLQKKFRKVHFKNRPKKKEVGTIPRGSVSFQIKFKINLPGEIDNLIVTNIEEYRNTPYIFNNYFPLFMSNLILSHITFTGYSHISIVCKLNISCQYRFGMYFIFTKDKLHIIIFQHEAVHIYYTIKISQ